MHNWLNAEAEVRRIGDLARQLVEIQERLSRQMAESKVAERRLVAEHAVSRILPVSDTLSDAVPKIIQAVCESLGWDVGTVWVVDRNANVLRCVKVWHTAEVEVPGLEQYTRHNTFPPGSRMPGVQATAPALADASNLAPTPAPEPSPGTPPDLSQIAEPLRSLAVRCDTPWPANARWHPRIRGGDP